ncbi:single-stranded DNA-binding protein [Butyrivibrio sp. CB08]|uniref:single-stranded DNA-binding protein n=1 Tax=Butyrivibrio sp. CB08 TaxID=2364879 RepID=UPI000EA91395|nr:single-stranded DNA-binding protein [Butyrivibrio sp. CB08]RKM60999.1 single-stranded DNA-binding protein [Butyrivibrio sp. CB08]
MNNACLVGRLTREPDVRYTQEGKAVARFTLAVDDYKETDFISCVAFDKQAEWLEKWASKGTKVELTGKIKTGSYTNKDGVKVYYTEVRANSVGFGESKTDAENRGQTQSQQPQTEDDGSGFMNIPDGIDEELPFK